MKTSTNAPTKAQRERFDLLHQLGCVVCFVYLQQFRAPDISHLLAGGVRIGHDATIPECCWHHRGVAPDGYTERTARKILGPSRAHGSKPYIDAYGDDACLRMMTGKLIARIQSSKRAIARNLRQAKQPVPLIDAAGWTIAGAYAVKSKSFGIAQRVAREQPEGNRGLQGTVEWMRLEVFEKVANA